MIVYIFLYNFSNFMTDKLFLNNDILDENLIKKCNLKTLSNK